MAEDYGHKITIFWGLFSKTDPRRGTGSSRPLISRWTAEIRSQRRERGGGGAPAGGEEGGGGRHCRGEQARRRSPCRRYGARFSKPKPPEERGGGDELIPSLEETGESSRGPLHGRRPWSSSEFTENGPREHHIAREKAEEGDEDEARSPTRRRKTKMARSSGFARPTNFSDDGSLKVSASSCALRARAEPGR